MDYELIRSDRRTVSAQIKGGKLIVRAPRRMPESQINAFLAKHKRWIETHLTASEERKRAADTLPTFTPEQIRVLAERAKKVISERVAYYAPKVGVSYGRITIRLQGTRWGSCSSLGNLNFNCLLMLAPLGTIDSVVVHELCHRKQMNHSPRFYREVLRVYPNYYEDQRWLKEEGHRLLVAAKRKNGD